jgi:hypothetical protein
MKILPWLCESCGAKWVDGLFTTWDTCPECEQEGAVFHESTREIREDDVFYE